MARAGMDERLWDRDAIGDEISGPFSSVLNGAYDRLMLLWRFDHADCSSQDFAEPPFRLRSGRLPRAR